MDNTGIDRELFYLLHYRFMASGPGKASEFPAFDGELSLCQYNETIHTQSFLANRGNDLLCVYHE